MTVIVGGNETGLLDSSLALLNRNDRTGNTDPGHGEQIYVNVANGNLLIQQQDAFLPSLGDDYRLIRTYNARGYASDAHQHEDARWSFSTTIRLDERSGNEGTWFEVQYGDGSVFVYKLDETTGLYVSTDGAGAFETIEDLNASGTTEPAFILTRADQTQLSFDSHGRLLQIRDPNGVTIDYVYESDRLVQVLDDQGHVINYTYLNGHLFQITDETEGVLAEYHYDSGRLSEVIDRHGHSTQYFYTTDGFLERVLLPETQVVNGQLETYGRREILIQYESFNWRGDTKAKGQIVTQITDAAGGITTFDYDFELTAPGHTNSNGRGHLRHGDDTTVSSDDRFFQGGTTTVVDALGNNRAYSNDAEYVAWRTDNGFYAAYDPTLAETDASFQAQVDAIRNAHSLTYSYDSDGRIGEVIDQQGFRTQYVYDEQENLISATDRNGWGATQSDSDYFRALRAELGFVDAAGNGKLVAALSEAEIAAVLEAFTSHFEYDERGNLLSSTDNADNVTTFTYTAFNRIDSTTSAVGNALVSSNDSFYQDRRVELGYAALAENLTAADRQAILDLHTTYFEYDANQNLIERRDAGGDLTRFEYDAAGNLTRQIVFLDPANLTDPTLQQVTNFAYDGFGNNISTTDAEGNQTLSDFDHFGNLLRFTDGNGGVTTFTYDADNRLLTVTDPEGHVTINTYDAVGNRISVTDAGGHTVTRLYDLNNNLISTIDPSETDPTKDRVTQFEYDVVGNRTATTDAEGRHTEFVFNERGELVEVVTTEVPDETGNTVRYQSTFAYDGESNTIRTTNNRGFTTEILYTRNNLVQQRTDPNGHVTRFVYDANNSQVQIIAGAQLAPALRQILQFSYDEENQLVTQTDAEGNVSRFEYDAPGNRVAVTDANGNVTEFEYDANNRLIREIRPEVVDPATGLPVRYTVLHIYDANGNEIQTIDENGASTRFSFDADDRLVVVEDANGIKTAFEYDSRHNRTAVIIGADATLDANGHVVLGNVDDAQTTRFVYDEFNQLVAQTDGVGNALAESDAALYQQLRQDLGFATLAADLSDTDRQALRALHTAHFAYDRVGNELSRMDNLGRTTSFSYDGLDRLVTRTDATGQTTLFRYDGNGNRVSQTDALGRTTEFDYDSVDRLTGTTDPLGVVASRAYDTFGNLTSETRAFGTVDARTTAFEYDLNNRVTAQIDAEGHAQQFEYDAVGNRLRVIDARGNATQFVYNALNRNVQIIDPLSFETRFEYDGVGNRLSLIDARAGVTRFEYDAGGRRISTTDAEGRVTTFAYDVRNNRIELRAAAGTADEQATSFEYDAENNLRSVTDAEGNVTLNDYDRVYNRIAATDGNGNPTSTAFDALNRAIEITDAEGGVTTFAYDAVGNRLTQTDALGRVTEFAYDAGDRLITQTAPDSVQTTFGYDAVGNRVSITRAANTGEAVTETFTYDLDDRLVEQADGLGNVTAFAYDENHNRTVVTDANNNATQYFFDANNRVVQILDPEGNTVEYAYDGNGNRTQVTDGRGFVTTTYYNANNEVALSVDAEGYATSFVYDNNGNVVSQTLHMQPLTLPVDPATAPVPVTGPDDRTTTFEYDRLNRVTARIDGEGYRAEFAYDAVGNQLERRQFLDLAGANVAVERSYYDAVNRQVASLTAEGYLTLTTYDAVGNRISQTLYDQPTAVPSTGLPQPVAGDIGRTEQFVFDAANRLVTQTSPLGVNTAFEYDARGNRTAIVEAAGTADQRRTGFAYDNADRLVDTVDALGIVTHLDLDANGNVVGRHDAFGTAEERLTLFVFDGNNRTISRTDALGVVTGFTYDANGNLVSTTRAVGLPEARIEANEYDANNRLTAQVNGEGERTESTYDGAGNRISLTVAPGLAEERVNFFEFDRDNRLLVSTDGEGVRTEYRYDGAGNKLETTQAAGIAGQERHSVYEYDLDNRLVRITDPEAGVTQYAYDVLGNQTTIVDANGGTQQNVFDALGRLISSTSAGGILTINGYDLRGNIIETTQSFSDGSDARTTRYSHDLLDRQIRVTDPEGFSTTIDYDVFGNQVTVTHGQYLPLPGDADYDAGKAARAFVQSNEFAWDQADRMLSLTDGEGNVTTYSYDAVGNRISTIEASNSTPRTSTFSYDRADRLIETVTPEGGITRSTYDEAGNRVAEDVLQSAGIWATRTFEYDGNGRLAAEIDALGVRNEREYDAMGNQTVLRLAAGTADERVSLTEYDLNNRVSAEIDAEGHRSDFEYDALGNRIKVTDALGRVARFYFDGANNLVSILDAEGYINTFAYDSAGNRVEERIYMTRYIGPVDDLLAPTPSASGQDRVFHSTFDGNDRMSQRIESDGSETLFSYDAAGNLIRETQFANTAAPRDLSYEYDLDNRLTRFTDVDGTVTTFTYDGASNKLSETISNASDPNAVRQTLFVYDLNNRVIEETFDPAGLNLVQTIAYDLVGNVTARSDANGAVTTFAYDLNNRVIGQTDALGNPVLFAYDAVGNQTSVTDANGNTTDFVYDGNNRVVQEIQPEVLVYTIEAGAVLQRPTVTHEYDAAGNEIQVTDASGFITTRYFDSNDRLVAEVDGDAVLREFSYNAAGERTGETLYMTRLASAAQDPLQRPAAPSGDARTISREYDLGGRVTRVIWPAVEITTLTGTDTDDPSAATAIVQPEERFTYDAFGNQVEIVDRAGNRSIAYYDNRDRLVAQVDAAGYLTEFDYDTQDNVIEQRVYVEPLDPTAVDPAAPPSAPAGAVYQTNRVYDAASRLIEERSPLVEVFDPATLTTGSERIVTRFTWDGVGNQLSRTLAADSPQASTEYSYYDALGRRVALIDGSRVVNLFGYDANGNQAFAKRFFNEVDASVDLGLLTGATDFAALAGSHVNDQSLQRVHDALNRLGSQTDLMGAGTTDDLTESFRYDATGQRTWAEDEDGYVQQFSYNALGALVRSVTPDGSGTVYEYDAAGNQIFAFTGQLDSVPAPALAPGASLGDELTFNWTLPAGANVQSYVVYDTVSRSDVDAYASQSVVQGTWFGDSGSVSIDSGDFAVGETVYFRVVTQDVAGNLTWTAEQAITIPPRFDDVSVAQPAADTLEVSVRFDAGVVNPQLLVGMPGSTNTAHAFVDQGGGLYTATLTGITNAQELAYRITWEDAAGGAYSSTEAAFEAGGGHVGISSALSEATVVEDGITRYRVNIDTTVPSLLADDLLGVAATFVSNDDPGVTGSASVTGTPGAGFSTFSLTLGQNSPLEAGTYTVTLRGIGETADLVLDTFEVTLGGAPLSGTERSLSWQAPAVGDDQVVIVDGVRVSATRVDGRLVVDPGVAAPGTFGYDAFYGAAAAETHTTDVTSTEVIETDDTTTPPTETVVGYDLGVSLTLSAAEAALVSGDVHLAWRAAGSGTAFANDVALTAAGGVYSTTLAELAAGEYDLKLYYLDAQANEVIVDWLRADTDVASQSLTGRSVTVLASETDAALTLNAGEIFSIDPGLYTGPVTDAVLEALNLAPTGTGNAGESRAVDGRDTGYFTENRYNALDARIATNAESGVWREFGVDANGNVVATLAFGEQGATTPITSYSVFDGRNREIARFAPETAVHGETGERRAVTRFAYDVQDNVVSETDALGGVHRQSFNALGSQISDTDALNNVQTFGYDRLGNRTRETDALGNNRYNRYDAVGRLIEQVDGEGHATTFGYDAFGRRTSVTNALNQSVALEYDHRDRLIEATDALGGVTQYEYDGRDNRTVTIDANGHRSEQVWDGLGRVADTITFQNGQEIHERKQYDAYGNLVSTTDGAGRVTTRINGAFGRVVEEIGPGGRRTLFEYDDFGRVTREWSPSTGKDIRRSYDDAGRLTEINDLATGVRTTYSFGIAGRRRAEATTTPGSAHNRSISYDYDALGQMVRWADSVTGMHTNYQWDAAGNLHRAHTDLGYDPDGEGLGASTRFIDHVYSFDANNRVTQQTQRGALALQYGYDEAGNRVTVNQEGTLTEYAFDANGRVIRAESGGVTTASWDYDDAGNVLQFKTFNEDGTLATEVTKQYYENNVNFFTHDRDLGEESDQQTTLTLDRSGRVLRTKLVSDGDTFYFDHIYNAQGLETRINARGKDVGGQTVNAYDANGQLIETDKGQGDSQERNEILRFVYNNDGQILYRFSDSGVEDEQVTDTEYAYANSHPVGQSGSTVDGGHETFLDSGRYNLVQPLGEDFPSSAVTFLTARAGDTLQGIAAAVYGNPSLWFVLAEANGLDASAPLREGQRLQIPNSIESGRLTADTHVLYDESEIIGSTLPNLKSDSDDGCGGFLAIIIVVVIAVVAVIATAGLAGAFLGTAGSFLGLTGTAAQIAAFAVAGTVVGAAASIVQQGLFIALGYQEEFSWKSVAAGAISGALSGAAQGVGQLVQAGKFTGETLRFAKVSARALQVSSAATKQLIEGGKITSFASLVTAAVGPVRGVAADGEVGNVINAVGVSAEGVTALGTALNYVTPWLSVAESFIRTGEVSAGDWASAVGATLTTALGSTDFGQESIGLGALQTNQGQLVTNLVVGGVLSRFDKSASESYFANAVGQEIGTLIGQTIADVTGLTALAAPGVKPKPDSPIVPVAGTRSDDEDTPAAESLIAPTPMDHNEQSIELAPESGRTTEIRIIQEGQTLSQIVASKYGRVSDELLLQVAAVNGLADPHLIQAGRELILPGVDTRLLNEAVIDPLTVQNLEAGRQAFAAAVNPDPTSDEVLAVLPQEFDGASNEVLSPVVADESFSDEEAAIIDAVIKENLAGAEADDALFVRGKDGRWRFHDPETGQFTRSPISREQLQRSRENAFSAGLNATLDVAKADVSGAFDLVEGLSAGDSENGARLGIRAEGLAQAAAGFQIDNKGLEASAEATAKAAISFASGQTTGSLGEASFDVASTLEGSADVSAVAKPGGPLGVQVDASAGGTLEAVALQLQGSAETAEVTFGFGLFNAKAGVRGELNVGGVGIAGNVGVQTTKSKPGVRLTLGAGLTPLVGGKVRGNVEFSFNPDRFRELAGTVEAYYSAFRRSLEEAF